MTGTRSSRRGQGGRRRLALPIMAACLAACAGSGSDAPKNPHARPAGKSVHIGPHRAYSGAPPIIPHSVKKLGRGECLDCHEAGDARKFSAAAPRTPHPELIRCVQCHVEKRTRTTFKDSRLVAGAYKIGTRSQREGPWLIPHPLTLRENCIGCHASPNTTSGAPQTDHPERIRCTQCHLPASKSAPGPRPDAPGVEGQLRVWTRNETAARKSN